MVTRLRACPRRRARCVPRALDDPSGRGAVAEPADPGLPRGPDGAAMLEAPAPRTAAGVPESVGGVEIEFGSRRHARRHRRHHHPRYMIDMTRDVPQRDTLMTAAAAAILQARVANNLRDNPAIRCLPLGVPRLDWSTHPLRIVQTPGLVLVLYESQHCPDKSSPTAGACPRIRSRPGSATRWAGGKATRWSCRPRARRPDVARRHRPPAQRGDAPHRAVHEAERRTTRHRGDDRQPACGPRGRSPYTQRQSLQVDGELHRVHLQREPRGEPAADAAEAIASRAATARAGQGRRSAALQLRREAAGRVHVDCRRRARNSRVAQSIARAMA